MRRRRAMYMCVLIIFVLCMLLIQRQAAGEHAEMVSLINLIASPEKYHNKKVRITGFAIIEFEGNAVFLSKEDAEYFISKNALWLDIDYEDEAKVIEYLKNVYDYAFIEGRFNANNHGHVGQYSGAITEITRIEKVERVPIRKVPREKFEEMERKLKELEEEKD